MTYQYVFKKMINFDTISKRLLTKEPSIDLRFVDCRYLLKYILKYPDIFPKFMRVNNYVTEFNIETGKWIHRKGKTFKKINLI